MVDLREKNTNNLESEQQIELNETNINLEETNVNTDSTNIEVSTESDINVENNIETEYEKRFSSLGYPIYKIDVEK